MPPRPAIYRPALAALAVLYLALLVPEKAHGANCSFRTASSSVNFATLNPAAGTDVTISALVQFRCTGRRGAFTISMDDGLYPAGPGIKRMRNTSFSTEFLPYSLSVAPSGGSTTSGWQDATLTGTVLGADYINAAAGGYTDSVTLTVLP